MHEVIITELTPELLQAMWLPIFLHADISHQKSRDLDIWKFSKSIPKMMKNMILWKLSDVYIELDNWQMSTIHETKN